MAYEEILTVNSSIQSKRTTKTTADSSTEVLKDGELLIVRDGTNPPNLRAGDGTTQIKNLKNMVPGVASTSTAGLMSSSDKTKLDGIATGANKTVVDTALSSTSTNPVQNKVINTALGKKLSTSGGTLTGNLTGKYITGTWLQTTEASDKAGDFATIDSSGWIYKRTASEANEDIITGHSVKPTYIELFPGASAGHGGYIDFHYNNNTADYTSRIIEIPSGHVQLNGMDIMTLANVTAIYNVPAKFTNGIFEYSNSAIKATSACFAQFRGSQTSSSFQDTALGVTSYEGKLRIVAKNGGTFQTNVNILIINP